MVTAVLEEALCILRADHRDRCAYRSHQRFAGASLGFAQQSFDLGKSPFDRIVKSLARVWWQVPERAQKVRRLIAW